MPGLVMERDTEQGLGQWAVTGQVANLTAFGDADPARPLVGLGYYPTRTLHGDHGADDARRRS